MPQVTVPPLPGSENYHSSAIGYSPETHSLLPAPAQPNKPQNHNHHNNNHSPTNVNYIETNSVRNPIDIKSPAINGNAIPPSIQSFPPIPSIQLTGPFLGISSSSSGSVHNDNINEPIDLIKNDAVMPIRSFPTLPPSFPSQTPPPPALAPVQPFPTLPPNSFVNEPPTPAGPIQPPIHASISNDGDGSPILYVDSNGIFQIQNPNNNDVHANLNRNNEISIINNDSLSIKNHNNNNRKKDASAITFNENEQIGFNIRMNARDDDDGSGFVAREIHSHSDPEHTSSNDSGSESNENDSDADDTVDDGRSRIEPRLYNGLPVFN